MSMTETRTYFRIQLAERDVNDLLDPGNHFSHPVNGSAVRRGVSVCDSLEDLALYLATPQGCGVIAQAGDRVIVELEGIESGDAPLDPEMESLIIPARIVSVTPAGPEFEALIAEQAAFLASFDAEPDFDDEG